jgi:hypothetical protein
MKPIRQGDVWLYPIDDASGASNMLRVSNDIDPTSDVLLALGEVTGHAHRIRERNARLYTPRSTRRPGRARTIRASNVGSTARRFLVVDRDPVDLVHEEHETLVVPPGTYEVKIQREYQPGPGSNNVLVYD